MDSSFSVSPLETVVYAQNSVTHRISNAVTHAQAPRIGVGSSFRFRLSCPPPAFAGKGGKASCGRSRLARNWSLWEPQPQARSKWPPALASEPGPCCLGDEPGRCHPHALPRRQQRAGVRLPVSPPALSLPGPGPCQPGI